MSMGTDTCAVMTSQLKGAVQEILKVCKNAIPAPCFSHSLNLSLGRCSRIPAIRNCISSIQTVVAFFNASAKRHAMLEQQTVKYLLTLAETRWVSRCESVSRFCELLPEVCKALTLINLWDDTKTASKANEILKLLESSEFIVALFVLEEISTLFLPIAYGLQKISNTVNEAGNMVDTLLESLVQRRENSESTFNTIYNRICKKMKNMGFSDPQPAKSRICGRQQHRFNIDANNAEEYYRINLFIPVLDIVNNDLSERLSSNYLQYLTLFQLLPERIQSADSSPNDKIMFTKYVEPFEQAVTFTQFQNELEIWRRYCLKLPNKNDCSCPSKTIQMHCSKDQFPNINKVLQILCTLVVSVASAERSFSALRRLKTWLRTAMTQNRLSGLAIMHIHRKIKVSISAIIDRFAKSKKRRLDFVI